MFPKPLRPLILFTTSYLLLGGATAILTDNFEFVFYLLVMLIMIAVTALLHSHVRLTLPLLWGLAVWGLLHVMGGILPVPTSWQIEGPIRVLYSLWLIPNLLKYDQVVHASGFYIATLVCWHSLKSIIACRNGQLLTPRIGPLLLVFFAGMGLGALNEVIEFIATLFIPETNVGDYSNTGWDLIANMVGGIAALCWLKWHNFKQTPSPF
ncbi:MAG: hypothetical protein ACSHYB_01600 [Roseibacillus sp.]